MGGDPRRMGSDDEGDGDHALQARAEALRLIDMAISEGVSCATDETSELAIRIDLLRLAGRYEETAGLLDLPIETGDDVLQAVLASSSILCVSRTQVATRCRMRWTSRTNYPNWDRKPFCF